MLLMPLVCQSSKEKLILLSRGLCHKILTKFSNFLVCVITISNLCCDLVRLLALCLCLHVRVSLGSGVQSNNVLLMH